MREEKPSETALLIAKAMVFLAHDPRAAALVPPEAAEEYRWFLESADPRAARLAALAGRNGFLRALAYAAEMFVIPGIMLHYAARKLFLEEAARAALEAGVSQVVVLGAGLDTLALRLHRERPDVLFFECDHPATQRLKRRAFEAHRHIGPNLHLVELDLARRTLEEALLAAPAVLDYRSTADTLLIAEGLTMYLQPPEMDGIFAFLREHTGTGSRFAFTFMEPRADGQLDFPGSSPFVLPWLRRVGEPFTWGIHRADLPGYLKTRGFSLSDLAGADILRESHLAPAGLSQRRLAVGEWVAVARRGGPGLC